MNGKVCQGFYDSLRKTLFAPRFFGAFPVSGLLKQNSKNSRITWMSLYTVYYVITVASITGCTIAHFVDITIHSRKYKGYGELIIQCFSSIAIIMVLRLALNWRNMMDDIDKIEKLLPPFKNGHLVVKNVNRIIFIIVLIGVARYIIGVFFSSRILYLCTKGLNIELTFENYFSFYYVWYFQFVPLNYFTAIFIEVVMLQTYFIFYYIDGLVIAVALYIIYRFNNFNRLMRIKMKKCNQNTKWSDIQAHFTRLTKLVKVIDGNINPFVFLCFLSNLVFICKTIYDFIQYQKNFTNNVNNPDCTIANSHDLMSVLNTTVHVTFRIFRALSVSTLCSYVHDLSRQPLDALHTLPASGYNLELQRFLDQVYYSRISLSGLQFFYVTRGTILTMVSTIITYELVLLQLPVLY